MTTVSAGVSHDSTLICTTAGGGARWPTTVDRSSPGSARCASVRIAGANGLPFRLLCSRCFRHPVPSLVRALASVGTTMFWLFYSMAWKDFLHLNSTSRNIFRSFGELWVREIHAIWQTDLDSAVDICCFLMLTLVDWFR